MFDSEGYSVLLCFLRLHEGRSVWAISSSCQINFKESGALTTRSLEECCQGFLSLPLLHAFNHTLGPGRRLQTTNAALIYQTGSIPELPGQQRRGDKVCWIMVHSAVLTSPVLWEEKDIFTKGKDFMEV